MSNSFNIGDLVRLAQSIIDAKTNGREFMLEDVHNITRAAYEQYPEDPVINQVAFTIERMAEKAPGGATISQAEISGIYNNFVRLSSNSKFRETLGHLLLDEPISAAKKDDYLKMNRIDYEAGKPNLDVSADSNMVNAISSTFTGSVSCIKGYDAAIAKKGIEFVGAELKSLGFNAPVEIMGGNSNNIVYAAHFDTRKGRVTVAIPTELSNNRVLFPSTFVADDHLEELSASSLSLFVEKKAQEENFSVPKTSDILAAVGILSGKNRPATEQEISELKNKVAEGKQEMELSTPNLFADRRYEEPKKDINTRQAVEMPKELAHLARDFEDDVLEAVSAFGLETIQKGKELIAKELKIAGFKNAQVKFGSESDDSVVYLAMIHTPKGITEIEVPVEMQCVANDKYVPLAPAYFAYDGLVEDFTAAKLQRFAVSLPAPSSKNITCTSSFSYMLLPELKDEILKSASESDYDTCEVALGEIQQRFSEEDFKNAIADYHFILMQKSHMEEQNQQVPHKCSKIIGSGHGSIEKRCGHLLLPLSQVITDENGFCRAKKAIEREKLNPAEETGAVISTSKINLT